MKRPKRHRIYQASPDTNRGNCRECGDDVPVYWDRKVWRCLTSHQETVILGKYGEVGLELWRKRTGCDICGSTYKLHIDHDAEHGGVRGILCQNHNLALGHFQHSPAMLRKAADYLEEGIWILDRDSSMVRSWNIWPN